MEGYHQPDWDQGIGLFFAYYLRKSRLCLTAVCLFVCLSASSRKTANLIFLNIYQRCIFGQRCSHKIVKAIPHADHEECSCNK